MKRVLIISDLHCGHRGGLTPPEWQYNADDDLNVRGKFGRFQKILWDWYCEKLKQIGGVDLLICNGDSLDGKNQGAGGTELLTADRKEQCEIAAQCISQVDRKKTLIIRGTAYHTGTEEDWEDVLADMVSASDVGWHEWVNADGVIFDLKHKTGRSETPYGRLTAPGREAIWNVLWKERGVQPDANVIVRSHVHYFVYGGDARRMWLTTPALQGWSKYGSAVCSGTVDLGMILFECKDGKYTWQPILLDLSVMQAQPLTL